MNSNSISSNNNSNVNNNKTQSGSELKGMWGGDHISLDVSENGATIDYDCAHGSMTEKLTADANGNFTARGFHVREHPGPTREGEDANGQPVIYRGSIKDSNMTLTVSPEGGGESIGTFNLTHGKYARIRKCG
jgi:hypothetical protein